MARAEEARIEASCAPAVERMFGLSPGPRRPAQTFRCNALAAVPTIHGLGSASSQSRPIHPRRRIPAREGSPPHSRSPVTPSRSVSRHTRARRCRVRRAAAGGRMIVTAM